MNEFRTDRTSLPNQRRSATTAISVVAAGLVLTLAGCTWVAVSDEGAMVEIARSESAVSECKQIGVINARTRSQIGVFSRKSDQIAEELEVLARNDAVDLGANTILPSGQPSDEGSQKFRAYRCPRS